MIPPPETNIEKLNDIIYEGVLYFGLPSAIALCVATYIMRGRAERLEATTLELALLSCMQYYGALGIGFSLGMTIYQPFMQRKIVERIYMM